ncbi:hypothetical protein L249_8120 [Ophiocordyceps polyrhachis-furcata BCC 54312]|uniref:Uncharacterized protein n=1 Tax=Ophiocordyceps polyrhachis-furcata BCC 54312 TaxID=1330021 RepID=A0A367LI66_9HYPO|nr:hypothetical protein L249_8120 [Ophiocordyceps polyrhachis-furcata BCC 54312]
MRYNVLVRASRRELIVYSTDNLFLATSLREISLALRITPTPKAPPIISLPSKVSNFANLFSKEKASALLPYYSS